MLPDPRWGLLLLLGGLTGFFVYSAVAGSARRGFGWGRDGSAGALSRLSYSVVGALLLCITLIVGFDWESPPRALLVWFGLNLPVFFAVGFIDVRRGSSE